MVVSLGVPIFKVFTVMSNISGHDLVYLYL